MASPGAGRGLPDFIVIGTMKGGTSSLHHYFARHPEICMAPKEPNFFLAARSFGKGVDWYRSLFANSGKVRGEASPAYSKRHQHEGVPERLAEVVPKVKLIYVLRDPIERIASHYLHNRILGRETRSFPAALAARGYRNNYVRTSMYAFQLEAFLPHFPLERILIATSEDLRDRRAATLRRMFDFIGVDPDFESREFDRLVNRTPAAPASEGAAPEGDRQGGSRPPGFGPDARERPALTQEDRARLVDHLMPDVERLRVLTGVRFEHWSL